MKSKFIAVQKRALTKPETGVILLAGILLTGLLTIWAYGSYMDQTSEQRILFANIKEYIGYLPGETALEQEMTDFGVLKISIDEDRDHGMAVYYPAFGVWYLNRISPYAGSVFWHTYTFLLVFWGICCLYFLGKLLFGKEGPAAFMTLLFFLTPRMFAESHYNNKDVVLLSLCFVLFYHGYKVIKYLRWRDVVFFSLAGALVANMKLVGAWCFGIVGLYILASFIAKKQMRKSVWQKGAVCILLWAGLYLLLTPAAWPDMKGFFDYLISYAVDYDLWHDYVLFQGKMVHKDYTGMPRKYLPTLMLYTIPVGILLLTACGFLRVVIDLIKSRGKQFWERAGYLCVIGSAGFVPLAYAVLAATPLYNGWRHFYFVYASVIAGAGYGGSFLWDKLTALKKKGFLWALCVGYPMVLAIGILVNFPQEHSYYNVLAGPDVVEKYELDYWGMSAKQAFESILKDADDAASVTVSALNLPTMWSLSGNYKVLPEKERGRLLLVEDPEDADYLIVNTTYGVMYSREAYEQLSEKYDMIQDMTSYGNVICQVYRRKED